MLYVGEAHRAHEFELFLGADASRDVAPPKELFRGRITSYMTHRKRIDELAAAADLVLREVFPVEPYPEEGLVYHPFVDGYLGVAEGLRSRSVAFARGPIVACCERCNVAGTTAGRSRVAAKRSRAFWKDLHEPYVRARFGKRADLGWSRRTGRAIRGLRTTSHREAFERDRGCSAGPSRLCRAGHSQLLPQRHPRLRLDLPQSTD